VLRCHAAQGEFKYVQLPTHSSPSHSRTTTLIPLLPSTVAKIDAVQAEYSAFETLHETDNLISTARELNIAYVAYSPLGHGWLVDDFPYESPEDFAPDDFRRTGKLLPLPIFISLAVMTHEMFEADLTSPTYSA
jgi:aryl-alcohol dehydrogenase-like predicted oxidoreductase